MNRTLALIALGGLAASASAQAVDLGNITLWGTEYNVRRASFNEQIQYPEPAFGGFDFEFTATEACHFLGNNRLLLATDSGDDFGSAKNQIVEVEILENTDGLFDGLSFVELLVAEDAGIPGFNNGVNCDPAGLTINTGADGFGAGAMVNVSGAEQVWAWDLAGGSTLLDGPLSILFANTDSEDIEYIPAVDQFFTISQDSPFSIIRFDDNFSVIDAHGDIPVGADGILNGVGDPKGIFNIPDGPNAPADLRGLGGTAVVVFDDTGPGLEAYLYDGTPVAGESLADATGQSILDFTAACASVDPFNLQLESGAFDPATGRIFLVNQGDVNICGFVYVLQPVDAGCNAADLAEPFGTLDLADITAFVVAFTSQDPSADIDGNGLFDLADITGFVTAFTGGCP
tara:strand:+ start:241 stop:1443 length:1203 start_codon:yes stop_codon:yes gene_type:complete